MSKSDKNQFPPQHQSQQPGIRNAMNPQPEDEDANYSPNGKLKGKTAIITGGDSGIGRSVAILFAKEGANISIIYAKEHDDADSVRKRIEQLDKRCITIAGDVGDETFCHNAVKETINKFGGLDILINNAAEQHVRKDFSDMDGATIQRTFATNIFSMFYMVNASLPYLKEDSTIINTTSITAYTGHPVLFDYSVTKGAITTFTRSLSIRLAKQGIRVNGVAPGPVWTPLIPASYEEEHVQHFGENTTLGRAGQPREIAPNYLFLASSDSSYMTGQVLHPNGGRVING